MRSWNQTTTVEMVGFVHDNVTATTDTMLPVVGGDLLTMSQYYDAMNVSVAIAIIICVGGIVGNILNIRTFLRMGLDDCMTIAFFNLAISDLGVVSGSLSALVPTILLILQTEMHISFVVQPYDVTTLIVTISTIFGFASKLLITFLAVQRALCVAIPFHFKGVFTRSRTFVIIGVIWAYSLLCQALLLFQYTFAEIPGTNGTRTHYVMTRIQSAIYSSILNVVVLFFDGFIVYFTSVTSVFVCVVIVKYVLIRSVRFRKNILTPKSVRDEKDPATSKQSNTTTTDKSVEEKDNLSGAKERQAIQQVLIVSIIYLITNIPHMLYIFTVLAVPNKFGLFLQYHFTYMTFYSFRLNFEQFNSAVNIFIYFKYNTKFRELCFKKKTGSKG